MTHPTPPHPTPPNPHPPSTPRLQRLHLRLRPDRLRQDAHDERHQYACDGGPRHQLPRAGRSVRHQGRPAGRGGCLAGGCPVWGGWVGGLVGGWVSGWGWLNQTATCRSLSSLCSLHNSNLDRPAPIHTRACHARPPQVEYRITVQMLEIYNENLRDLLGDGGTPRLEILSTQASGCNVPGAVQVGARQGGAGGLGAWGVLRRALAIGAVVFDRGQTWKKTETQPKSLQTTHCTPTRNHPPLTPPSPTMPPQIEVEDSEDVISLMARGAANRATSETKMNDRSSRR